MEDTKINLLLAAYHEFCMKLIKMIPLDNMPNDSHIQTAFRYRDEIETAVLELQINAKEGGKNYISQEIEQLKQKINQYESKNEDN